MSHAVTKQKGAIAAFLDLTGIKPVGAGVSTHGSKVVFFGRITPTTATSIIESFNDHNRVRRDGTALEYAQSIYDKDWEDTGIPILFDENGQLVDGQHRLAGCVIAKKPITALIVFGVNFAAYRAIDRGKKRRLSDDLHTDGHAWAPDRAKLVKLVYREETGNLVTKASAYPLSPSQADASEIEDRLGDQITQALHFVYGYGHSWHPRRMFDRPLAAYLFLVLNQLHQPGACQFLDQLITGVIPEGAHQSNPATVVRNRLLDIPNDARARQAQRLLTVQAGWNRYCAHGNKKLSKLDVPKLFKPNGEFCLTELKAWKKPNRRIAALALEWFNEHYSLEATLNSGANAAKRFLERAAGRATDVSTQADRLREKLEV